MPVDERYRRQVELLVRTLPHVARERCFALNGGTAINLFVRNLPRLSVDIDLTYLPVADRAQSLADIEAALRRIGEHIREAVAFSRVQTGALKVEGTVNKLFVREYDTQIKIEVTPVLRGCVFEPREMDVSDVVEEQFGFAAVQVVSFPDLFAGKIVAALDRQHPRRPLRRPWTAVERRNRRQAPHRLHRLSGEPSSADREVVGAGAQGHA